MKTNDKKVQKFNFWLYFGKHKFAIAIYLLLIAFSIVTSVFSSIYIAKILEVITQGLYFEAIKMFIIVTVIEIITRASVYINNFIYQITSTKVANAMSIDIAVQAFKISDKSYADHSTANFTQRIDVDPDTIINRMTSIVNYIAEIIRGVVMITYILFISPLVGSLFVVSLVLLTLIEIVRGRVMKKMRKETHKKGEVVNSLLNEVVRSEKDVKSLNLEETLKKDLIGKTEVYSKQNIKTSIVGQTYWEIRSITMRIITALLVAISLLVMDKGAMTLAGFMVVWSNRGYLSSLSHVFGNIIDHISSISLASERINELFEDDEYETEKFGKRKLKKVKGKIEFKNVSFTYTQYRDKTQEEIEEEKKYNKKHKIKDKIKTRVKLGENKVLKDLSFEIEPNTTVAFVGKSGSGKSTILNLMAKMMETEQGKVLLDGIDIKSLSKDTIRNSISLVNQFPYIFDMTIRENLLLAKKDATEEEINQAVEESALGEFIDNLPEKLETRVGEGGIKLSGGQKQRVAIARAMLRKTPIIIFDESTSSLDNLSQNMIKKSIENIKGKITVVIVAHRLSTIKNADVIFFLDEGKIVDQGTFEELYKKNKAFKTMFLAENI